VALGRALAAAGRGVADAQALSALRVRAIELSCRDEAMAIDAALERASI